MADPDPNPNEEKELEDFVREWTEKRGKDSMLPFLSHEPKLIECKLCFKGISPKEEIRCTVSGCQSAFHLNCAEKSFKLSKEKICPNSKEERNLKRRKKGLKFEGIQFKCPQHGCFVCKQIGYWRCVRCVIASHTKCAPWCERVIIPPGQHARAVCWKHPSDWLLQNEHADVTLSIEEVFDRLPVPYFEQEFSFSVGTTNDNVAEQYSDVAEKNADVAEINADMAEINADVAEISDDMAEEITESVPFTAPKIEEEINFSVGTINADVAEKNNGPDPFIRIRRNIYLVKRKRESHAGVGCTDCTSDSTCKEDCECRGQSVSCSKACHCSDFCTNKPFRKEKKIKIIKTEHCGWGVITLEPLEKGDFIVEYIGEVIDDITCEKRLWDIKKRGDFNFYMCEISKDFTIDATFKGNTSRFLNHSCDPNCKLEKWQVDGETRVGVFASKSIKIGEPLTYDYRFVHFGPMVVCKCGASNCQGFLGSKKIVNQLPHESVKEEFVQPDDEKLIGWGQKTKRSEIVKIRNQTASIDFQNQLVANQTHSNDLQNQLMANQTHSNDLKNEFDRNQTPSNDSQRNQTPSNGFQNQLMRNGTPSSDPQNELIRNQTPSSDSQNQLIGNEIAANDSQNQFEERRVEIPHEIRSVTVKENRPLSWGRRIKRSYTVTLDQNGPGN